MSSRGVLVASLALAACGGSSDELGSPPLVALVARPTEPLAVVDASVPIDAPVRPAPWTFAVMSDLHLPNPRGKTVDQTIAALVTLSPRLVIITGDHTNGSLTDGPGAIAKSHDWWRIVRTALEPLRAAHIPVLPIAPFTYSVEVEGVHFSLAHIVGQYVDPGVATWLAADLAKASSARARIVFGHVPLASVIPPVAAAFAARLGALLRSAARCPTAMARSSSAAVARTARCSTSRTASRCSPSTAPRSPRAR